MTREEAEIRPALLRRLLRLGNRHFADDFCGFSLTASRIASLTSLLLQLLPTVMLLREFYTAAARDDASCVAFLHMHGLLDFDTGPCVIDVAPR